jgi:hypothetical protein
MCESFFSERLGIFHPRSAPMASDPTAPRQAALAKMLED